MSFLCAIIILVYLSANSRIYKSLFSYTDPFLSLTAGVPLNQCLELPKHALGDTFTQSQLPHLGSKHALHVPITNATSNREIGIFWPPHQSRSVNQKDLGGRETAHKSPVAIQKLSTLAQSRPARSCRQRPPRSPSRERRDPLAPRRTRLPPYPLRHTSERKLACCT